MTLTYTINSYIYIYIFESHFGPPITTSGHTVSITAALEHILLLGEKSLFLTVLRNVLDILIYYSFQINFHLVK